MRRLLLITMGLVLLSACTTVKYTALEKVGVQKRDILVDRIQDAQHTQERTKQQFGNAYEIFSALVKVDAPKLEKTYEKLSAEVQKSEAITKELDNRIDGIERVSKDLFAEWKKELSQYSNPKLKAASAQNLQITRQRYAQLIDKMRRAQQSAQPVLHSFQDNVLFLKHNLNARAVQSLSGEVAEVQLKVKRLIEEMEAAIQESSAFVRQLDS